MFSNQDEIKKIDNTYNGEYGDITIKQKYEKYPKIKYPLITIEEISNEDVSQYYNGEECVSYLAYQIEINCGQDEDRTANQNVRRIAEIIDGYMKQDRYKCMRRLGSLAESPLSSDNNIMVGHLRYECNLDIKTNTIYRRY